MFDRFPISENVPIKFREKDQVITKNSTDPTHLEGDEKKLFVVSDITSTITLFVAIFFPSVTGEDREPLRAVVHSSKF